MTFSPSRLIEDDCRYEDYEQCPHCCGEGQIEYPNPFRDDPYYCEVKKCLECNGSDLVWRTT